MTKSEKVILAKAVKIRVTNGEDPKKVIQNYTLLTDQEKYDVLREYKEG